MSRDRQDRVEDFDYELPPEQIARIIGACLDLERCERFADVLPLLTVDRQSPADPAAAPVK